MADVPKIMEEPTDDNQDQTKSDMQKSDEAVKRLYPGLTPRKGVVAQRKISTGGTQYFDSGEYAKQKSRSDKQKIASNPKPFMNPALAHLHKKPPQPASVTAQNRKSIPSGLATSNVSKVEH